MCCYKAHQCMHLYFKRMLAWLAACSCNTDCAYIHALTGRLLACFGDMECGWATATLYEMIRNVSVGVARLISSVSRGGCGRTCGQVAPAPACQTADAHLYPVVHVQAPAPSSWSVWLRPSSCCATTGKWGAGGGRKARVRACHHQLSATI